MTGSQMNTWLTREMDLAHRHEELLLRREALLQGTETYYDEQEKRAASFIASFPLAEERNMELLDDLNDFMRGMQRDVADPGTPRFNTMKNNYWTMVKNVFPVWMDEVKDYNNRQMSRSGGVLDGSSIISPRPPAGSPPPSRTPRSPKRSPRTAQDGTSGPSPTGSPLGTLEGMIVNGRPPSPGPRSPTRSPSPNGRPPSPERKSALKKSPKKSSKGGKSSKKKKK